MRTTHGRRSAEFVHKRYNTDPRWTALGSSLVEVVARLSLLHVNSAYDLKAEKGFRYDEVIGTYKINMVYLGLILRLADILDFDRDRTPDSLYRTIDFRSQVSLSEWEKHRSVNGWVVDDSKIQFTMICEHPEYQRAAYQFMDWIDKELTDAQDIIRNFPAEFSKYKLELARQVDRSRIEPKNQSYDYHDLEFSLSRDEIVKLLMTEKLYGSPHLAIRELLQNSLDALRHRKAQIKRDSNSDWNVGKVTFEHFLDEHGHENISCTDNGVGMDKDIILRFLTNAGRSYYRSPEFEQERIRFKQADIDFDPCAQFGIGFMSCFMLGDQITIHTRRDNGEHGRGEPLIVEINGFNSMIVLRKGKDDQPIGTTVKITGRKLPRGFEKSNDKVRLIDVLNAYAIATEFPIEGKVTIPELENSTSIPPQIAKPLGELETANLQSIVTFEQDLSEIHPQLNGIVRADFIIDDKGQLALENDLAKWEIEDAGSPRQSIDLFLLKHDMKLRYFSGFRNPYKEQICIDGILIAGSSGRTDKNITHQLDTHSSPIRLGRFTFILNITGAIKPPITPARTPPGNYDLIRNEKKWTHIKNLALRAQARIWEKIAEQLRTELDHETFWQLVLIYNSWHDMSVDRIRAGKIWELISVPLRNNDGTLEWIKISDLGKLVLKDSELQYRDGRIIGSNKILDSWLSENSKERLSDFFTTLVFLMSTIGINNDELYFEMRPPNEPDIIPAENYISDSAVLPYDGNISNLLSVHNELLNTDSFSLIGIRNVNKSHPLVQLALEAQFQENRNSLQEFAVGAVSCLSDPFLFAKTKYLNRFRERRNVGFDYQDVDWNGIDEKLKPPYLIRKVDGEIVEITGEDFNRWAEIDLNAEDFE